MEAPVPRELSSTKKVALYAPPVVIVLMLVLANLADFFQWKNVRVQVAHINGDSLASIRLVERMNADMQHTRDLAERHILEPNPSEMGSLEQQIAESRADFEAAAREYAPIAVSPGEPEAFHQLKADAERLNQDLNDVLSLSRRNMNTNARLELMTLEPTFVSIERDANTLVQLNQIDAQKTAELLESLQGNTLVLHLALALATVLVTLLSGFALARRIQRREIDRLQYAEALVVRNHELDAFSGRVAHDLRGPLSVVSLATSKLQADVPKAEPTIALLRRGVGRMEALIADLLALARIDRASATAVASITDVTEDLEKELRPKVQELKGTLRVSVEPALVRCSEGLLHQVLWNLGENALKYRREDVPPDIAIEGHVHGMSYHLRVVDNGIGMSPDEAQQAFEPLYRAASAQGLPGTGLGLSIVKRIVEAVDGNVGVESRPGRGSTFFIELRVSLEPAASERRSEHDHWT